MLVTQNIKEKTGGEKIMNANINMKGGESTLTIKFQKPEITLFEKKFEELGLIKSETEQGFNKKMCFGFWKENGTEVKEYVRKNVGYRYDYSEDNINGNIVDSDKRINLAVVRVIPNKNGEIILPMGGILGVNKVNNIVKSIAQVYATILNVVTNLDVKIEIESSQLKVKEIERTEVISNEND